MLDLKVCFLVSSANLAFLLNIFFFALTAAANEGAIAALTDTVGQYFMNLGKTMRVYLDKYGKTFSPEVWGRF